MPGSALTCHACGSDNLEPRSAVVEYEWFFHEKDEAWRLAEWSAVWFECTACGAHVDPFDWFLDVLRATGRTVEFVPGEV